MYLFRQGIDHVALEQNRAQFRIHTCLLQQHDFIIIILVHDENIKLIRIVYISHQTQHKLGGLVGLIPKYRELWVYSISMVYLVKCFLFFVFFINLHVWSYITPSIILNSQS